MSGRQQAQQQEEQQEQGQGQQQAGQEQQGAAAPAGATLAATAQADAAVAEKGGVQAAVDRVARWVASCEQQVRASRARSCMWSGSRAQRRSQLLYCPSSACHPGLHAGMHEAMAQADHPK